MRHQKTTIMKRKPFSFSKQKTFFLLLGLALFTTGFSQTTFGIHGGVNVSNWKVEGQNNYTFKSLVGLQAGVSATLPLSSQLSVQPEVTYTTAGTNATGKISGNDYTWKLHYAAVPVLLRYRLPKGFAVYGGPSIGFLLSGTLKTGEDKQDIKKYLSSTDVALAAGAEYTLPKSLFASARYHYGLKDIHAQEGDESTIHNRSFSVSVGYRFGTAKTAKGK